MGTDLDIEQLTSVYKLLGDETRLRVLALLRDHELAVGEIQKILGLGQSTLSSQLAALKDQALVTSRKEGQKVYYRLPGDVPASPRLTLTRSALDNVASARWYERDRRHLKKTLAERQEASRAFFNQEAVQNRASPGQTWQALSLGLLHLQSGRRVVDLGCGSGRLARLFAEAGHKVTALDNSEEQIRLAKKAAKPAHGSVEYRLASMEATGLPPASCDLLLLSQSLHHAANPKDVIQEAFRLADKGGRILILDLLAHEEDWMRAKFGDFWLGFSEADLKTWLKEAGFRVTHLEITEPSPEYPDLEGLLAVGEKP